MSKAKIEEATMEDNPLANPQGKTVEELVQIAQNLQLQKNQHHDRANQYQKALNQELTMGAKAQGGLEVILQMIPKKRVEKMIEEEQAENYEMNGQE